VQPVNTAEPLPPRSTFRRDRREVAGLAVLLLIGAYIGTLAFKYYFGVAGVRRHHLESAWMWLVAAGLLFTLTSRRSVAVREPLAQPWGPPAGLTVGAAIALAVAVYYPALAARGESR
jgi:hypothetical protein